MRTRIVSFPGLGTRGAPAFRRLDGPRDDGVRYRLDGYVSAAPSHLRDVALVQYAASRGDLGEVSLIVVGTARVRERWFGDDGAFWSAFDDADVSVPIGYAEVPDGGTGEKQWQVLGRLCDVLREEPLELRAPDWPDAREGAPPDEILIDVTDGVRALPLLAVAAVAFAQSQRGPEAAVPGCRMRVLQASPEDRDQVPDDGGPPIVPIRELTERIDVLRWKAASFDLMRQYLGRYLRE